MDSGKGIIEQRIQLSDDLSDFHFTGSNGTKYLLSFQDHVMRKTYTMGMYERNTIRQLVKLADKDMTFVDVGANIGAYTLNIARHVNNCYAFEPSPRSLRYLNTNVNLNALPNVKVVPMGLSDNKGEAELFIQSLGSSSFHKHQEIGDSEQVKLTTLDSHCSENNIERVDMIKLDIEGHEMQALLGAQETLKRNKKMVVVLELDNNTLLAGYTRKDYLDFMDSNGFKPYVPKAFPFPLKKINELPDNYKDNVVFLKGY